MKEKGRKRAEEEERRVRKEDKKGYARKFCCPL